MWNNTDSQPLPQPQVNSMQPGFKQRGRAVHTNCLFFVSFIHKSPAKTSPVSQMSTVSVHVSLPGRPSKCGDRKEVDSRSTSVTARQRTSESGHRSEAPLLSANQFITQMENPNCPWHFSTASNWRQFILVKQNLLKEQETLKELSFFPHFAGPRLLPRALRSFQRASVHVFKFPLKQEARPITPFFAGGLYSIDIQMKACMLWLQSAAMHKMIKTCLPPLEM